MTTHVAKGANRPAAMARKAKHDQRTPLPPKKGVVAETKAIVEEVLQPSVAKATEFAAAAKGLGWVCKTWWEGDHSKVLAERGAESIQIEWLKGVFVPETCSWRVGDGNAVRLRNASAAKKQMAQPASAARPSRGRLGRQPGHAPEVRSARRAVMADLDAMTDPVCLDMLRGKRITWINRITGQEETDVVRDVRTTRLSDGALPNAKVHIAGLAAPRITEGPAGRVLHFLGMYGFRCVLVSQITVIRK